jgi:hypothetical protein
MMMMTMRVPRPIVTLRFIGIPLRMWRFRNKEEWLGVPPLSRGGPRQGQMKKEGGCPAAPLFGAPRRAVT